MFDPTSRYYALEATEFTTSTGRTVAYVRRRFIPSTEAPTLAEVTVNQGDRLDLITARTIGDPQQFWRICDANTALNPAELTAEAGRRLRIALPQA